ncbi:YbaB/EbfC family nucleoid-associated protein [Micromonospora sp. DR5-3]|uniref:YbaB/EbfC family nucleoid-associated protein n=1 Tax=unclassified Micromonospora TaxID=2617518 RepID=UPI0011DACD9E|nr:MULTISPECIES: YbaB/EbfC family nucleoid-associated protein [unclassified Micromonospora]MCW3814686.1 YbaB/EbfC family nucleoid-associated protein [Micromonospora sp. DR5-3]TYC23479.1 YbaB/EbfC family nucleoid-associated protein [Micromonospora sp. MP36]
MAESADRAANRAMRARFDEVYGQCQRFRSELDGLPTGLAELRVTERPDDGQVTTVVGARGELISVGLAPSVFYDRDAKALSRKITDTVLRASAAATAIRELVAGYLSPGSPSVEFLRTNDFGALLGRADAVLSR